jgi:hypothetical protein
MLDLETTHEILLSLPNVVEDSHFDKPAYKVNGKILGTFNIENRWVTLRLTPEQQAEFCENPAIYPVPNKWGQQGWTHVSLDRIKLSDFKAVLQTAYGNVLKKKK